MGIGGPFEREKYFLKNDITRYINLVGRVVKTFITFVKRTIAKKNIADRARLEFMFVVGT